MRMVETQLKSRGINDERILEAFREVPRHLFVPPKYAGEAYGDYPLPVGEGQTISQPFIVAEMTLLLNIKPDDKILEIGTGSGYQAAIIAYLGVRVYTVEKIRTLIEPAIRVLKELGLNVNIIEGDGSLGYPRCAPYNGIIVTAAAPEVPEPLLEQLDEGARLVIPVGSRFSQILKVYEKINGDIKEYNFGGCIFVPLVGEYGWDK